MNAITPVEGPTMEFIPATTPDSDLLGLINKLGDLVCDQDQMTLLAVKNSEDQSIVAPLVRFIRQLNDEIFEVYQQLREATEEAKKGGA
jgi:hypothetical protein